MGMYHCPECGEMVLAGLPHPDYSVLDTTPDMPTPEQIIDGPGTVQMKVERLIELKAAVLIYRTNEAANPAGAWAVCVRHTDFWLDALDTLEEAKAFCARNNLPYVVSVDTDPGLT